MIFVSLGYSGDRKQLFIILKIISGIFIILAVLVNELSRAMAF